MKHGLLCSSFAARGGARPVAGAIVEAQTDGDGERVFPVGADAHAAVVRARSARAGRR